MTLLVAQGANKYTKDRNGWTPMGRFRLPEVPKIFYDEWRNEYQSYTQPQIHWCIKHHIPPCTVDTPTVGPVRIFKDACCDCHFGSRIRVEVGGIIMSIQYNLHVATGGTDEDERQAMP